MFGGGSNSQIDQCRLVGAAEHSRQQMALSRGPSVAIDVPRSTAIATHLTIIGTATSSHPFISHQLPMPCRESFQSNQNVGVLRQPVDKSHYPYEGRGAQQQSYEIVPYNCATALHGSYDNFVTNGGGSDEIHLTAASSTPTPWRYTPPSSSGFLENASRTMAFRRTPGARRPVATTGSGKTNGIRFSALQPRPLFSGDNDSGFGNSSTVDDRSFDGGQPVNRSFHSILPTVAAFPEMSISSEDDRVRSGRTSGQGVDLIVSNLDYNISSHEWKKILMAEFHQQVQVKNIVILLLKYYYYLLIYYFGFCILGYKVIEVEN